MERNREARRNPDLHKAAERLMRRAKARPTPFRLVRAGQDAMPFSTQSARHVPLCVPTVDHLCVALLPGLRLALKSRRSVIRYG